jgi:hypothetical protein
MRCDDVITTSGLKARSEMDAPRDRSGAEQETRRAFSCSRRHLFAPWEPAAAGTLGCGPALPRHGYRVRFVAVATVTTDATEDPDKR